jgi:hypothetical protein
MMKKVKITMTLVGLLGILGLVFLTNPPVTAKSSFCNTILITPTLTGMGANCTQATADLTSQINGYVAPDACGPAIVVITNPCHPEGSQICVQGYGRIRYPD